MKAVLMGAVAAAAMIAGGAASAQTAKPKTAVRQAQPLTRAVVQSRVATMFAKLDANHDGFISKDEINAVEAKREQNMEQRAQAFDPDKIFGRLDANHDGKITVAEAQNARSQRAQTKGVKPAQASATSFTGLFARADANKDGVITKAEFDTMGQQIKARMEHAGAAREGMASRMFTTADANKDGRVSLTEMQQIALARFDRADLNRDGTITPQERQQLRAQLKAHRQPSKAPAEK